MTVAELMTNRTPSANYEGWVRSDDHVLAVDCGQTPAASLTASAVAGFCVAELGVSELDAQLNPITQDKVYLRTGQSTIKTGNQRGFRVKSDRYAGDGFQDFCLSHGVKYGTGSAVVRRYVYFNLLTGKGESGEVSVIVTADGSGSAGESAGVVIELKKTGAAPAEYNYAAS